MKYVYVGLSLLLAVFSFLFVMKGMGFIEHRPSHMPIEVGFVLIAIGFAIFIFACHQLQAAIHFWQSQKYRPKKDYTLAEHEIFL